MEITEVFYEEKVIDGVLMCRGTPRGEWSPVSPAVMTERLMLAEAFVRHPHTAPAEVERTQFEAMGWWDGDKALFEPGKIPVRGALLFRPVSPQREKP